MIISVDWYDPAEMMRAENFMATADVIAPLANFQSPKSLVLDEHTEICELTPAMSRAVQAGWSQHLIRHPSAATQCVRIRDVELKDGDEGSSAKDAIEEVILRLRLFKPGRVSFDFGVIDQVGWFDDPAHTNGSQLKLFGVFFYVAWAHSGMPGAWTMDAAEAVELSSFFTSIGSQRLMERSPFRYFFQSYHEPYAFDRFLKNAIGLECILANDMSDTTNIKYKFVDRGCFLLHRAAQQAGGAQSYADRLSDIYNARCKLVHGSTKGVSGWPANEKDRATLKLSEEYLRTLLRHVLNNPELESATAVDAAKRSLYK